MVRPLIWKQCSINRAAAQTDTTSQRTVPQPGVGTSRLCVKQLHGSESGWAVIRDASWGRCGVGQLREGHLGAGQRCFSRDILTSCDPPSLQLASSLSSNPPFIFLFLPPLSSPSLLLSRLFISSPSRANAQPVPNSYCPGYAALSQERQQNAGLGERRRPPAGAPDAARPQLNCTSSRSTCHCHLDQLCPAG